MASSHLRWLASVVGVGTLAVSGSAHAAVVWTSTFEKGDLSEWSGGSNTTKTLAGGTVRNNVEVLGEQAYKGKYACKITVHPDDLFGQYVQDRVDITHPSTLTAEGTDTWVSGHYMMPADAGVRNEFAFWESHVSFTNVMDFWVEPKTGGGTTVNFGVGFLGATKVWTADFAIGKWHQVSIHVHWSVNPQMGSVDVWFDGQQVVTAYKAKTKADGNTLFYENGLHRRNPANFVDTIYMDDFVEADSFAEAQIGAPMPQETDGGTSIEAGADGGMAGVDGGLGGADGGGTDGANATAGDDAGAGGAMTGVGVTTDAGTTTGLDDGSTNGGGTGATGAGDGASGSNGGCAILSTRMRAKPRSLSSTAPLLALIGIAFVRRRRRGR